MSGPEDFALKTPPSVAADAGAVEVLRMWWSQGEPVMAVKPAFNDPAQFGRMLAYAARHMAHGYRLGHGLDEKTAYNLILTGLSAAIAANDARTVAEPDAPTETAQ